MIAERMTTVKLLNILEKNRDNIENYFDGSMVPYSLEDVRRGTLMYLQGECDGIVAVGNKWLLDFSAVTAMLCGNNAPWSRLLFDDTVFENRVPITFYPVDFLGCLNMDHVRIVDFCDMDVKTLYGDGYKRIPKVLKSEYIMAETKNRRCLYFLEAIEKGLIEIENKNLQLGQQYIDGDYNAFETLLGKINRNEAVGNGYVSDIIMYLMAYGANSYYDWYAFFLTDIFKGIDGVKGFMSQVSEKAPIDLIEKQLLLEDNNKIKFLFKRDNEAVEDRQIDELMEKVLEV